MQGGKAVNHQHHYILVVNDTTDTVKQQMYFTQYGMFNMTYDTHAPEGRAAIDPHTLA